MATKNERTQQHQNGELDWFVDQDVCSTRGTGVSRETQWHCDRVQGTLQLRWPETCVQIGWRGGELICDHQTWTSMDDNENSDAPLQRGSASGVSYTGSTVNEEGSCS